MSLMSDLVELGRHLQQERLFVSTEREQLQQLYDSVRQTSEKLLHVAWIARHQKSILNTCMTHGHDVKGINACGQSNELENTNFVDSYKHFSHHDSKFGDLLKFLWDNPILVGQCIYEGEKTGSFNLERIITTVTASIFGGCMFREDETAMLQILKLLTEMQLANDDNPRRLLRRGSCAFFLLYKQLCDCLFSARQFLTATLHDPIMRLLMEDEWFYDIDPSKAMVRFPPKERQKRFGDPGTDEYRTKQQNYRKFIVDKLVMLAQRFITSIKANLHCFPPAIAWLTSHVFTSLTQAGHVDTAEVRAACADLVFALFICPAICDPEPYGITSDIPISHIARHNLMQIAQIVQVLAISRWDEIDPKVRDLYGHFEKGCMSSVLDCFLEGPWDDVLLTPGSTPANLLMRSAVLMTPSEVKGMVAFLRQTCANLDDKLPGKKQLEHVLSSLPLDVAASQSDSCLPNSSSSVILDSVTATSAPAGLSTPDTPGSQRKLFKSKTVKKKPSVTNLYQLGEETGNDAGDREKTSGLEDVLVITVVPPADCPGMIAEKKVLAWEYENRRRKVKYPSALSESIAVPGTEIQEKRTRFSLSHDQESIGNTSDCQEAISEAASSHSVDENELDNFSDMMSANVSGRGSPSISGRDTPLSQAGSVEENPRGAAELPVPVPETVQKQNRVDVTDRFGKFDLEPGDEIKSTVSDTWSTDVLASDSEPPDQNQLERLEEVAEEMSRPFILAARDQEMTTPTSLLPPHCESLHSSSKNLERQGRMPVSEISETASDAWSTDVLASDTDEKNSELLKELDDQDEVSSIVDRDEADSSVGQEDIGADEVNLDALGAVGGAALRSEELSDFGDMLQGSPESPKQTRDDTGEPARKGNLQFSSPHSTQGIPHSSQSLHPPQFHRLSHGSKHEGRQAGLEPQHMVRRAWKERHSDPVERHHQQQQYPNSSSQQTGGNGNSDVIALLPRNSAPHHSINPAINVWVSTNGQISGNSTRGAVVDKQQQASSLAASGIPAACPLPNFNTPPPVPPRPLSVESSASQSQAHQRESYNKDRMSQDSGNPLIEITEDIRSFDSPSESADLLIDLEHAEPLTIAEQQNTCIDENRLSAALSMFDPFASEGEADGSLNNDLNTNCSTSQSTSVFGVSSGAGDNLGTVSSHSVDSAIGLLCEDDSAFKDSVAPKAKEEPSEADASSDKDAVAEMSTRNSGALSSQRHAPDNISIRSDEKDFQEEDGDRSSKTRGFFRTFFRDKLHKGIKRKTKSDKEFSGVDGQDGDASKGARNAGDGLEGGESSGGKVDTSDDILAKYRTPKKGVASKIPSENMDQARDSTLSQNGEEEKLTSAQVEENTPFLDPSNLETCFAFQDAKRKLRLVLSMCEIQPAFIQMQSHSPRQGSGTAREQDLVYLLRWQLAEAINLQNKDLVTRLHEAIRCVKLFDADGSKKLLKSLREEYRNRAAYISYLVRCRQGLLAALAHLQKMLNRVEREREICRKHLISVCVRLFIDQHEQQVVKFISKFQSLAMADEKTDLVEEFLQYMYQEMSQDHLWKAASESQSEDGKQAIERSLMSRIYTHAMFPNGDGDILRDQLIQQHIKKLSAIITPTHRDLRIPRVYHFECPWPAAQRDIVMINAYKTPKDKLKCVLRCSQTIMNLLSMANEKTVPAADDFMPVLIFVLIKANPPCLLSTIQYVESFYVNRLQGEEQYWWLQFSSAVEFIKTMDYSE